MCYCTGNKQNPHFRSLELRRLQFLFVAACYRYCLTLTSKRSNVFISLVNKKNPTTWRTFKITIVWPSILLASEFFFSLVYILAWHFIISLLCIQDWMVSAWIGGFVVRGFSSNPHWSRLIQILHRIRHRILHRIPWEWIEKGHVISLSLFKGR